jgi:hypothetical protein
VKRNNNKRLNEGHNFLLGQPVEAGHRRNKRHRSEGSRKRVRGGAHSRESKPMAR